jgi:hypothetical protein
VGWLDSITISAALAANPQLRRTLHELISRVSDQAFNEHEIAAVERELVSALKMLEIRKFPSSAPAAGQPLILERSQVTIIFEVIGRFRDPVLRKKAEKVVAHAIGTGRVLSV